MLSAGEKSPVFLYFFGIYTDTLKYLIFFEYIANSGKGNVVLLVKIGVSRYSFKICNRNGKNGFFGTW